MIPKNLQLYKFSAYGFLKNQRFFEIFIFLFFLEQSISFLQIGLLISIREISILLFEIPTGIIADSFGRRSSMIFCFFVYILSFLIFFLFPGFLYYSIGMILFALGEAFRTGTHKALILEYLKINNLLHLKVEYYGYTRSWSQIGSAFAALVAAVIVSYSGSYKYVFLGSTIPYLLALGLMFSYPKELDCQKKKERNLLTNIKMSLRITFSSLKISIKQTQLKRALLNSAIFDGIFKTVKDYIQPILQILVLAAPIFLHFEKREAIIIAIVYFNLYILTAVASRHSGRLKNRFVLLSKAVNSSFLIGILIIFFSGILLNLKLEIVVVLLFILMFVLQNMRRPINIGYISENISHDVMASGLSVESQLKTLCVAVMSPLMGFLADRSNIGVAFIILSSLTLLIFPLIKVSENQK
ncbi:MAG: MFS transporter [Candidatus Cloacimonetes bacterium]|nr:MFS transporter [Candidatus Cloacimonadota bacterium]